MLADAGVSKEIIKAFIQKSSIAYDPSAVELIALTERGVPDEVITALMERGANLRAQTNRASGTVAMPAVVRQLSTGGTLDPDSYEFWNSCYAYPRALSYSYRTLTPYVPLYSYSIVQPFPSYWHFSPGRVQCGPTGVRNSFRSTIRGPAFTHRTFSSGRTLVSRSRGHR